MYKKKIFPIKIFNSFSFTLLTFVICFVAIFYSTKPDMTPYILFFGLIIVILSTMPNFIFRGIKVSEEEIIIKTLALKGYKKYKFPLKNIIRMEMKKGKAYLGLRRYYYALYLITQDESFIISEERYFIKDLESLFHYLNTEYNIPCNKLK